MCASLLPYQCAMQSTSISFITRYCARRTELRISTILCPRWLLVANSPLFSSENWAPNSRPLVSGKKFAHSHRLANLPSSSSGEQPIKRELLRNVTLLCCPSLAACSSCINGCPLLKVTLYGPLKSRVRRLLNSTPFKNPPHHSTAQCLDIIFWGRLAEFERSFFLFLRRHKSL